MKKLFRFQTAEALNKLKRLLNLIDETNVLVALTPERLCSQKIQTRIIAEKNGSKGVVREFCDLRRKISDGI